MSEKRYYWLKLKEDFFGSRRIKKLRKLAGGDTYTIIYLKMQLAALRTDGVLTWTGLEDNIFEELALELDEEPDNVEVTLRYLLSVGLAESDDMQSVFLPWVVANTGSEGQSAERVRKHRENKALQRNLQELPSNAPALHCNTEKEKELEIELETEKENVPAQRKPKEEFHKYGEFGWVKLTDKQYTKLLKDLGEAELKRCIQYVDESAQGNHNKNHWTDWNLIVRRCAREGWGAVTPKRTSYVTAAEYDRTHSTKVDIERLKELPL